MTDFMTALREGSRHVRVDCPPAEVELKFERFQRRRRRRRKAAAGVTLGVMLAIVLAFGRDLIVRPDPHPVATIEAPSNRLVDGSTVTGLSPDAELQVLGNSPDAIGVRLSRGRARFDVTHRPGRDFVVSAGSVSVRVIGTSFEVEMVGERTRVRVLRGLVRLHWPEGTAELGEGQSGVYPPTGEVVPEPSAQADGATSERARPKGSSEGDRDRPRRATPARGARQKALDEAGELLSAADSDRAAGKPEEAARKLEIFVARYPRDRRASSAAFMLGALLLRDLSRPAAAAEFFEKSRTLNTDGSLAEDALARAVEAWSRARRTERAREAALRYLEQYPEGRWLPFIRGVVGSTDRPDDRQ